MDFTQNERLNQINEQTLIIGIDIAKHKHVARAIDDRGIVTRVGSTIKCGHIPSELNVGDGAYGTLLDESSLLLEIPGRAPCGGKPDEGQEIKRTG